MDIRDYLHDEINIQQRFAAHNITKIVNSVLKRSVAGGAPLVAIKHRKKWEAYWCWKVDNKTVFLLSADSDTYAFRAWCQHSCPQSLKRYSH